MLKRQKREFTHQLDGPVICRLFVYPSQEQCGIHTWMKCLCGSCGIQPHIPRDLEEFYPPMYQVMGRQTCVLSVDLAVAYELAPAPVSCSLGSPGEHLFLIITHRQESLGGSPEVQWRSSSMLLEQKLYKFECIEEGQRIVWFIHVTFSTRWHSSAPRETFSPLISNAGESESIWRGAVFPSSTGCSQRGPFLSCSIQSTELWAEWWRQEEA